MSESKDALKKRARKIAGVLARSYPDAHVLLDYSNPLELLIATILAAQCTDRKVNEVTAELFKKYKSAEDWASAHLRTLQSDLKPTGTFRQKAKSVKEACRDIVEKHDENVPGTMEELTALRGVGRKTANVVLANCFDRPAIIVDTHFRRVTGRLGLTRNTDPDKIEADVQELLPEKKWTPFSYHVTFHGRNICVARKPKCEECPVNKLCDYYRGLEG